MSVIGYSVGSAAPETTIGCEKRRFEASLFSFGSKVELKEARNAASYLPFIENLETREERLRGCDHIL